MRRAELARSTAKLEDFRHASAERIAGCSLKRHVIAELLSSRSFVFPDHR